MQLSPEELLDREARKQRHTDILQRHLRVGDLLTHTRCVGIVSEHRFVKWETGGNWKWLTGKITSTTKKCGHETAKFADDISPFNVTHVNRVPINDLDRFEDSEE